MLAHRNLKPSFPSCSQNVLDLVYLLCTVVTVTWVSGCSLFPTAIKERDIASAHSSCKRDGRGKLDNNCIVLKSLCILKVIHWQVRCLPWLASTGKGWVKAGIFSPSMIVPILRKMSEDLISYLSGRSSEVSFLFAISFCPFGWQEAVVAKPSVLYYSLLDAIGSNQGSYVPGQQLLKVIWSINSVIFSVQVTFLWWSW